MMQVFILAVGVGYYVRLCPRGKLGGGFSMLVETQCHRVMEKGYDDIMDVKLPL